MTEDDVLFGFRLRLFTLAQELGSVSEACRAMGVARSTYYAWKPKAIGGGHFRAPAWTGRSFNREACATAAPRSSSIFGSGEVRYERISHPAPRPLSRLPPPELRLAEQRLLHQCWQLAPGGPWA